MIQIIEIIKKADQGFCKPFLCKGDDGYLYYVKGFIDGRPQREDQVKEWICAHLARAFDLPVPNFYIVDIPQELHEVSSEHFKQLGYGPAFASRYVQGSLWMESQNMIDASAQVAKDILLFDYWIRNLDRTKGNTNLLADASNQALHVIDHNQAFDVDYSDEVFFQNHVFTDLSSEVFSDIDIRSKYLQRIDTAIAVFSTAQFSIPEEWHWLDVEQSVPADIDYDAFLAILSKYNHDQFWSIR
jgi:hypothetical protein